MSSWPGDIGRPPCERSSYYPPAIVCRRGHVYASNAERAHPAERCSTCGAKLLRECLSCGEPIRGELEVPGVLVAVAWSASDFCHMCGAPFPWASRQARIFELQNLLDEEELDEATRLQVSEQLESLANDELDEQQQEERWRRVKELAPGLFESGRKIVETVMTAAIKAQIGL